MTAAQIAADVEKGLQLRAEIKAKQAELKAIEKRLEQAGLEGDQIPLQDEDREGRQFLARSGSAIVPVVFESDQLIASFAFDSAKAGELHKFAEDNDFKIDPFYAPEMSFHRVQKDGLAFRKLAREKLGITAPEFLALCIQRDKTGVPKSRTVIAWDNAKHPTEVLV